MPSGRGARRTGSPGVRDGPTAAALPLTSLTAPSKLWMALLTFAWTYSRMGCRVLKWEERSIGRRASSAAGAGVPPATVALPPSRLGLRGLARVSWLCSWHRQQLGSPQREEWGEERSEEPRHATVMQSDCYYGAPWHRGGRGGRREAPSKV